MEKTPLKKFANPPIELAASPSPGSRSMVLSAVSPGSFRFSPILAVAVTYR